MAQNIKTEARQRIRSPIDLDFMTERLKTENDLYTFPNPSLWTIEKNLYYLLKNSIEVDLESRYIRKPYLLSFDQYNTVVLEFLLMYVNGIYCSEDFNIPTVILPTLSSIIEVCSDKFNRNPNISNLTAVNW